MSFIDELIFHSRMQPERAAIVLPTGRYVNWRQFGEGVAAACTALARHNVTRADLVSLETSDAIFRLVLLCALMRMGVCLVNSGAETTMLASEVGARVFLCGPEGISAANGLPEDARIIKVTDDWFLAPRDSSPPAAVPPLDDQVPYEPGLPAIVFFTSGTTGRPSPRAMSFAHFNVRLARRRASFDAVPSR
jgi:acyl-coenzyme A synthetase/AMP-(fatty) acid ligase